MSATLREHAHRWAASFNRRRGIEAAASAAGLAMGLGALVLVLASFALAPWVLLTATTLGVAGIALWSALRWRAQRIHPAAMAARVDAHARTQDLMITALAIERGDASGDEGFARLVHARALSQAASLDTSSVAPLKLPLRALAAGGLAMVLGAVICSNAAPLRASLVALSSSPAGSSAALAGDPAKDPQQLERQQRAQEKLDEQTRQKLEQDARALDAMQQTAGLGDEAKQALARASEQLRRAAKRDARALGALGAMKRAQREMKAVEEQAREGEHIDEKKMDAMSPDQLAEQLEEAAKTKAPEAMAHAAEALARKIQRGLTAQERERLARKMSEQAARQDAAAQSPGDQERGGPKRLTRREKSSSPSSSSGAKKDPGSESMRKLSRLLREGDRDGARQEMEKMARQASSQASRSPSSLSRRLSSARRRTEGARRATMARMGEKSRSCDDPATCSSMPRRVAGSSSPPKEGSGSQPGQQGSKSGQGPQGQGSEPGGQGSKPGGQGGQPAQAGGKGSKSMGAQAGITRKGGGGAPTPGGGFGGRGRQASARGDAGGGEEWVSSQWREGGDSIVQVIEKVNRGEDSVVSYRQVHRSYESIAESATEREEIPLTRRAFIQNYFEAIRPQDQAAQED